MDSLQEILFTLRQNKLRTGLTAFGVFWGLLMLILLLGAGRGMEKALSDGWSNDVADSIWIIPSTTSVAFKGMPIGRQIQFTEDDMNAIRRELPGVRYISSENPSVLLLLPISRSPLVPSRVHLGCWVSLTNILISKRKCVLMMVAG